jgi:hypothetical protein
MGDTAKNAICLFVASSPAARQLRGDRNGCRPCAHKVTGSAVRPGVIRIHHGAMVAVNRSAVDQQIATAIGANMRNRGGFDCSTPLLVVANYAVRSNQLMS